MHTHDHESGHSKAGIFPFPVFAEAASETVAPQHPEDGHVAFALIGESVVRVMWDAALGSYIEPSYRMHVPRILAS